METAAISLRQAKLVFGDVTAINELTFSAPKEKITVLLGANGAGKTTAMRLITGALVPTSGAVEVLGVNPSNAEEGNSVRARIGIVPAKPALYERASGWDNLRYAADIYGVDPSQRDDRIKDSAERFDIDHVLHKRAGEYSTGMKTRLVLARSILHSPDLLLYDEPTSGLDPESSKAVLDLIREMTSFGKTVLMCTHLLIEAEDLADQIVVMDRGSVRAEGSKEELIEHYFSDMKVVIETLSDDYAADILRVSENLDHVTGGFVDGRVATITITSEEVVPAVVARVVESQIPVHSVVPHSPTLEDLYFASQQGVSAIERELR